MYSSEWTEPSADEVVKEDHTGAIEGVCEEMKAKYLFTEDVLIDMKVSLIHIFTLN